MLEETKVALYELSRNGISALNYIKHLEQEIDRLNNIINELEKILSTEMYRDIAVSKSLDKLKELKEE